MDIFFSLFSKSSLTLLRVMENSSSNKDNKPTSLFYTGFSEECMCGGLGRAEFIPHMLQRMVKDGGWRPADLFNAYLACTPVS